MALTPLLGIYLLVLQIQFFIENFYEFYKRGNFHWAKLSRYPQYMDFHGNIFAVQLGTNICLCLELNIHRKNFRASLKDCENHKSLPQ